MRIQICVYKIRHCCQKYYLNTSYEMYLNILTKLFFVILLLNTKSIIGYLGKLEATELFHSVSPF